MNRMIQLFFCMLFVADLSFCSSENNQQLLVHKKPSIRLADLPSSKETRALVDQNKKLWKKNVAEQCVHQYKIQKYRKIYDIDLKKLSEHNQTLQFKALSIQKLQQYKDSIQIIDADQFVTQWAWFPMNDLSYAQNALCQNIYFGRERLGFLSALWASESQRIACSQRIKNSCAHMMQIGAISSQEVQNLQAVQDLLPIGFTTCAVLQEQIAQSKFQLQCNVYQQQVQPYLDRISAIENQKKEIETKVCKKSAQVKNIAKKIEGFTSTHNELFQEFTNIIKDYNDNVSILNHRQAVVSEKLQDLAWKKIAFEQRNHNEIQDRIDQELERIEREQDLQRAQEEQERQRLQAIQQKQELERQLQLRQEKNKSLWQKFAWKKVAVEQRKENDMQEELERRQLQSRLDKQRYLEQLTIQAQEREQLRLDLLKKSEEQRYAAEQERIVQESRAAEDQRKKSEEDALLEQAVAVADLEKSILAKIPKLDSRLSFTDFVVRFAPEIERNKQIGKLFIQFQAICKKFLTENATDADIDLFDDCYEKILNIHKDATKIGAGVSYYMVFNMQIYKKLISVYDTLHEKNQRQVPFDQLELDLIPLNQSLTEKEEEFALLKKCYASAMQQKNQETMNFCLPLMHIKKRSIQELSNKIQEVKAVQRQQYVYECMLDLFGSGGKLDPFRLLDDQYPQVRKEVALSDEDVDMRCVVLHDHIDAILQEQEQEQEQFALPRVDSMLKISQLQSDQVRQKTTGMIRGLLRDIGLENHPLREGWVAEIYNTARSFCYQDACNEIDLDTYRYQLHKIFSPDDQGPLFAQYNSQQDLRIKLIRLFAIKFHGKKV